MKNTSDKVFDTDTIIAETGKPLTTEQKKYLELLGAYNLDTQFNQAVQRYDQQLKVQAQLLQIQSDVASLGSANQMAETSQGLGTGAQGVQAAQFQYAVQDQNAELQSQLAESRTQFMTNLAENYAEQLSNILGEQDENGNFSNILQYQQMTDYFLEALQEEMVWMLTDGTMQDGNGNNITDYQQYLMQLGYVVRTEDGNYETTELGDAYINQIINGNNIQFDPETGEVSDITTERLVENMAETWAINDYGINSWNIMTFDQQEKALAEYKDKAIDWLIDNNLYIRHTHLGLTHRENGMLVFDTMYTPPETTYENTTGEVLTMAQAFSEYGDSFTDKTEFKNGQYVLLDGEYYIYDNYNFYKTTFTGNNPPSSISATVATSQAFGYFNNKNKNQDNWVQGIIDAANDDRIEDGTYIDFNSSPKPSDKYVLYRWNATTQSFDKIIGKAVKDIYTGNIVYYNEDDVSINTNNGMSIINYRDNGDREIYLKE